MSKTKTYQKLKELEQAKPEETALLKEKVKEVVRQTEKQIPGKKKGQKKYKEALEAMIKVLFMLVDVPGPIDDVFKEMARPHIPDFVNWAVDELNNLGWA